MVIEGVSDYDTSLVFHEFSQVSGSDLRVNCSFVDSRGQLFDLLVGIKFLADSQFELLKKVDDSCLDELIVLQVGLETELKLVKVEEALVILSYVEHHAADVGDFSSGQGELLHVEKLVDELIFVDLAIERLLVLFEEIVAGELIDVSTGSELLKHLSEGVQISVRPKIVVFLGALAKLQTLSKGVSKLVAIDRVLDEGAFAHLLLLGLFFFPAPVFGFKDHLLHVLFGLGLLHLDDVKGDSAASSSLFQLGLGHASFFLGKV